MSDQKKQRFHVRRGDDVVVISGSSKGRRGKIREVLTGSLSVVLEASDERSKEGEEKRRLVKPVLHYMRKSQQNPEGGLLWLEGPVHVSNVMRVDEFERRRARRSKKS